MTKQEAKGLTLEVWRYLAAHPEIEDKSDLPEKLWNKIRYIAAEEIVRRIEAWEPEE